MFMTKELNEISLQLMMNNISHRVKIDNIELIMRAPREISTQGMEQVRKMLYRYN